MEQECMHRPVIEDGITVCADCGEVLYRPKLQINPQPLRIVPQIQRDLMTVRGLVEAVRCKAITGQGWQCTRTQDDDSDYCYQHKGLYG